MAAVNGINGMNAALNQVNGALNSFQNITQYSNGVNNMNGLYNMNGISLNAYATGLNNVNSFAAFNATSTMVNGNAITHLTNLQNLTGQGVTGFTPTLENKRTLTQNGFSLGNNTDFNWLNNFFGTPYQQNVNMTSNRNNGLNNPLSGLNMAFPSTLSSLPGQQNMFTLQNPIGNGIQAIQYQRPEQLAMKMMAPSPLEVHGAHVAHGN